MLPLPSFTTPATEKLCTAIAKKSKGVCFLGFSGGKDSICAWLNLRKYFDRVIPFHCATLPGMTFREKALRYYEDEFDRHILRMMDSSLSNDLIQGIYQLREDGPFIAGLGWHKFDKIELVDYLRAEFSLPKAWCAFGIQASDSIDRRIYCTKYEGRNDANKTFYPCWDWPHGKVIETVREAGLKLSSEYLYSSRTIEGTPSATYTEILRERYPRDYAVLRDFYPLVEAKVAREKLNDRIAGEFRAARVRENCEGFGKGAEEDGESGKGAGSQEDPGRDNDCSAFGGHETGEEEDSGQGIFVFG